MCQSGWNCSVVTVELSCLQRSVRDCWLVPRRKRGNTLPAKCLYNPAHTDVGPHAQRGRAFGCTAESSSELDVLKRSPVPYFGNDLVVVKPMQGADTSVPNAGQEVHDVLMVKLGCAGR